MADRTDIIAINGVFLVVCSFSSVLLLQYVQTHPISQLGARLFKHPKKL